MPVPPKGTWIVAPLTTGGGKFEIVKVTTLVPVPAALVAETVTIDVPVEVGDPLIRPVIVLIESPAGNPAAAYDVGEFEAVI